MEMNLGDILLQADSLPLALQRTTRAALAGGALVPILTERESVVDGDVSFLVRVVSSLQRKEADRLRRAEGTELQERRSSPFLPPEGALLVAEVSRTHIAVLNKFNVLPHHLLIVTRRFEHQETLLTPEDLLALFACMAQLDGLGFYNGGRLAGASQSHKHLQLVPLPLAPQGPAIPLEPLLAGPGPRTPALPFAHAFGRLTRPPGDPLPAVGEAHALYLDLLAHLGIGAAIGDGEPRQSAPYNLLVAHDWMLAVPRVEERYRGIPINALAFAGSLFVKDRHQLALIRAVGPMQVLQAVAGRAPGRRP